MKKKKIKKEQPRFKAIKQYELEFKKDYSSQVVGDATNEIKDVLNAIR